MPMTMATAMDGMLSRIRHKFDWDLTEHRVVNDLRNLKFWRLFAGLACILVGYKGTVHSLSLVVSVSDAEQALLLDDSDGRIVGKALEQAMALSPESDANGRIAQQAKLALLKDPTAVEALIVLGLQAQLREEVAESRRALSLARRLSLRELKSNIWRIEEAVALGDIDGALTEYDLALRTSKSSRDTLFPVLARALREPEISRRLVTMFSDKASWHASFIGYSAANYSDPAATVTFFRELDEAGLELNRDMAILVDALVARNHFSEAQKMHGILRGSGARDTIRNGRFSPDVEFSTVLDWSMVQAGGLSSTLSRDGQDSYLSFDISNGSSGVIAQQLLMLTPGTYRISGRASQLDRSSAEQVYWTFRCLNGLEIGEVQLEGAEDQPVAFSGTVTLPASCPQQNFALVSKSSRSQRGISGRIHEVSIAATSR